jgi:hypothetical protein
MSITGLCVSSFCSGPDESRAFGPRSLAGMGFRRQVHQVLRTLSLTCLPSASLQSRRDGYPFNAFARLRIAYAAERKVASLVSNAHAILAFFAATAMMVL